MSIRVGKTKLKRLEYARSVFLSATDKKNLTPATDIQRLEALRILIEDGELPTFVPMLPLIFNLNGRPYELDDHFPFEPLYNRNLPENLCLKTGRQTSKSTNQASRSLLLATSIPYFTTLFVFPLYEQVRRFSTQYVRKFIDESPLKKFWTGSSTENSVLQRSFTNFSKMFFSFATLSADRIRGISANMCAFDEVQDLDPSHLPIIRECMSHSVITDPRTGERRAARLSVYTGTPKSLDNTLEREWQRSSQAEWVIPCLNPGCNKYNYPARGLDLEKMIGPYHDDIGEVHKGKKPAVICAKCGRSVNPRDGFWHHKYPALIRDYPGFHVPQIIMPIHYAEPKAWGKLVAKQNGAENYTTARFYNEVLGESYDLGAKLITETDMKRAAVLGWRNDEKNPSPVANRVRRRYTRTFMGVDWGGGGEEDVSFTTAAVVGLLGNGSMEVVYGRRLLFLNDPLAEAVELMRIYNTFHCDHLAHDYNGAGSLHEVFMLQAGLSLERVVPFVYYRSAAKDLVVYHGSEDDHHRSYYLLDKARSLKFLCELIKLQRIRFFDWDFVDVDNRGLLHDFLSLVEHKTDTARAGEVYSIHRAAAFPDDFAHSVNFAAMGLFHHTGQWPNLAQIAHLRLSQMQHDVMNPPNPWVGGIDPENF